MSNRKCCVPGCINSLDTNATLHKFPNPEKYKELFNTWVYTVGGDILQLENEHIFKYRRVCRVHFKQKYWCRNNLLSKDAVPTINMPGLSFLKFSSESRVLRPLQTSEASTSKEPVTSHLDCVDKQLHTQSVVEDVQMKENLEPVPTHLDSVDKQLHTQSAVEDVQMKEYVEPVPSHLDSVDKQLHTQSAVEDVQMKEYVEPVPSHLDSVDKQLHTQSAVEDVQMKEYVEPVTSHLDTVAMNLQATIAVENVQIKKNLEHQKIQRTKTGTKKNVKRVAVTPSEHALYKKLILVGVKQVNAAAKLKSRQKR